ncbi:MAG TPA: spore protease YyaC [Bacillota bacterium]
MNLKRLFKHKQQPIRSCYEDPTIINTFSQRITSWLPKAPREYVITCIGTDRSTGDSLGPLTGTFLTEMKLKHMTIYGTLHHPVHATNIHDYIDKIRKNHRKPFIIAVDACLGRASSVGHLIAAKGPLQPGAALSKPLPKIGDLNIVGVVNLSGYMEYSVLQNTRLSIVSDMANKIAAIINKIDQQLTYDHSLPAVVGPEYRETSV